MTQSQPPARRSRRHGRSAATIRDVAAQAGVSVATVSRVLNGKEVVRAETLRQVLEAAKALSYVPNVAARALSIRRSQTVGIVLPDVHGEFFSELIRGIDVAARGEGYHILVSGSHSDAGEMLDVLEAMLGHARIAYIKGPAQNADARERLRGFRDAMRALGMTAPAALRRLEIAGEFTEESGHAAALQILKLKPRPTAIFAANDSMAVGALAALAEDGVAVPAAMSVTGFDDIPIARYIAPPLTTIRVDIADLGRRAFGLLLGAIDQPAAIRRRDCIATTLVVRKSSCSPEIRRKGEES
jgi:LacI family transcriptional regulator